MDGADDDYDPPEFEYIYGECVERWGGAAKGVDPTVLLLLFLLFDDDLEFVCQTVRCLVDGLLPIVTAALPTVIDVTVNQDSVAHEVVQRLKPEYEEADIKNPFLTVVLRGSMPSQTEDPTDVPL